MIRFLVLAVFSSIFINDHYPTDDLSKLTIYTDSLEIDLHPIYDETGLLNGYKANVFTPICEEDKCYAVEIDFYWDLIGRYDHFDTIPGSPLTKLEHEPLNQEEYIKLDQILSNPSSVLATYKKEDLVKDIKVEGVDGVSGATIAEIKESVITGAVYSCYTLWHIVHGAVVDSIRSMTYQELNEDLVSKMVEMEDQQINYYLIDRFSENDFLLYLNYVLQTIENGEGYYPKNAIEEMPNTVLNKVEVQEFFALHFEEFNYFTQLSLLKKLKPDLISRQLRSKLKTQIDDRNSQKNRLILELIGE
ncbi:MAG: hypothetical protein ACFHWX_15615 [Bacteroidota bacterium]